ncbi:MAG: F0F1 ATP synthase subunit B [Opitutales bacterium]
MLELIPLLAAAGDAAHAAADAAHGAGHGAEDPRFAIRLPKIVSQLIAFAIVAWLLNKFAFGPLLGVMDERQQKIDDGLKYAEQMQERLADAEAQHEQKLREASEEASKLVAEARQNAKAYEDRQREQAAARAEEIVSKAKEAMATERAQLLEEIRAEATKLVVETTAAVLAKQLTDDERSRYSDAATEELASRN